MVEVANRREMILHSAAELFAKKGIAGTTVREIADAVGVLSGSLYHHFKSKDEIVDAIVRSYLTDLIKSYQEVLASGEDPRAQLSELVRRSLHITEARPFATEIYQMNGNYLASLDSYEFIRQTAADISATWVEVLESGVETGVFRSDLRPRVTYRLLRDALWLSVRWFRPTKEYPLEQFGDELVSQFLEGILPR